MSMLLDEDQTAIRDTAERYFANNAKVADIRRLRDAHDLTALARGTWDGMVEMGLSAMLLPEELGGSSMNFRASAQVAEQMGRTLAAAPFISTAVMAATAILGADEDAAKAELAARLAAGETFAVASEESARHAPQAISTTVTRAGEGWTLSGDKLAVIDGNIARHFIVAAREGAGVGLYLVPADGQGVAVRATLGVDSRPSVRVAFDAAPATLRIAGPETGEALLDAVYDAGRLHLAAEMLGATQFAFDTALDYLKTRSQFGVRIGSFQALQHRAAIAYGQLDVARSTVLKAAAMQGHRNFAKSVSLAKWKMGEVARHVVGEAVQFHGGIGVTDDFDMGFYLKRVRAASTLLGDPGFHMERFAGLVGL